ncbi:hypothetical protein KAJ87_04255 [Candidatus Pacearchaeota archaeon]|nr:hypothetical protein [Candidatus Pacearchaeota archaeon]
MEKQEILKELKKQFDLTKKRLGFKSLYEEINEMSYIEDMALSQRFVSNQFSRQIINRMVEGPHGWLGELYSWVYPGQMDIIHMHETKKLSKEEKKEILDMIDRIMYLVRKNKRIAFDGLKPEEEGPFVDELIEFDKRYFNPFMLKYHKKFEKVWEEEILKESKKI